MIAPVHPLAHAVVLVALTAAPILGQTLTPIAPPGSPPGTPAPATDTPRPAAPPRPMVDAVKFEGDPNLGKALKSSLSVGQRIELDLVMDQRYTVTYVPPEKAGTERLLTTRYGVVLLVKAVEPTSSTVELSFESVRVDFTPSTGDPIKVDGSAQATAPATTPAGALQDMASKLLASKLTLTLLSDNTIAKVDGTQELIKLGPARLMRRILEEDGLRACIGPALTLRPSMPQVPEGSPITTVPDGTWPASVVILADRGRQGIMDLRRIDKAEGPKTSVKGSARLSPPSGNVGRDSMYLRDASVDTLFTWDTATSSLISAKAEDSITLMLGMPDNSRQAMTTITTTTITPRPPRPASPAQPAPAPNSAPKPTP